MTPLKRAAQAVEAEFLAQGIIDLVVEDRVDLRALARAVLTAIREPSEAMLDRGMDGAPDLDCSFEPDHSRIVWQAMIDAALGEQG